MAWASGGIDAMGDRHLSYYIYDRNSYIHRRTYVTYVINRSSMRKSEGTEGGGQATRTNNNEQDQGRAPPLTVSSSNSSIALKRGRVGISCHQPLIFHFRPRSYSTCKSLGSRHTGPPPTVIYLNSATSLNARPLLIGQTSHTCSCNA